MGNAASLISSAAIPSSDTSDTSADELSLYDTPLIPVDEPRDIPADTAPVSDTIFTESTADSVSLPPEPSLTVPVSITAAPVPVSDVSSDTVDSLPVTEFSTTADHSPVSGVPSDTAVDIPGPSHTVPQSPVPGVSIQPDPDPQFFFNPPASPPASPSQPSADPPASHRYNTRHSSRGDIATPSILELARSAAIRRSCYKARVWHSASVHHISVNKALKTMTKPALVSMYNEVSQLLDKKVFFGRKPSFKHKKKVIKSFMFLKEKHNAAGVFEKLKARLVAGGHMQDRTFITEDDSSSPTASLSSLFTVAALAARGNRMVRTADIAGAYLNADISHKEILMELDPTTAAILVNLDPSYEQYLRENGSMVVQLQKALYGCVESGKLWYDLLSSSLKSIGYVPNLLDPCVFNKTMDGKQSTIVVYVDDLFISSESLSLIEELENMLKERFGADLQVHEGPIFSYLGMTWDYSVPGQVKVTMRGFIDDLLTWSGISGSVQTPASTFLFTTRDSPKLSKNEMERFHSAAAKLLYLAKRVRPDILLAVSFLTTRVQSPDVDDGHKLDRVLKYLNGTQDMGIVLRPSKSLNQEAYIDASYGTHADGKSHSGMVLSLGRGPILVKSTKQKIVTKSSTESELVALSDLASSVIWNREFLLAQGETLPASTIYQDNQSTMALVNKGSSTSDRTRHIKIRHFWVKDQVSQGEVQIVYIPTEDMTADILTKPLQGQTFIRLRQMLLNWEF